MIYKSAGSLIVIMIRDEVGGFLWCPDGSHAHHHQHHHLKLSWRSISSTLVRFTTVCHTTTTIISSWWLDKMHTGGQRIRHKASRPRKYLKLGVDGRHLHLTVHTHQERGVALSHQHKHPEIVRVTLPSPFIQHPPLHISPILTPVSHCLQHEFSPRPSTNTPTHLEVAEWCEEELVPEGRPVGLVVHQAHLQPQAVIRDESVGGSSSCAAPSH
jgi:hypothetical protein